MIASLLMSVNRTKINPDAVSEPTSQPDEPRTEPRRIGRSVGTGFRNWKLWAIAGGFAFALILAITISVTGTSDHATRVDTPLQPAAQLAARTEAANASLPRTPSMDTIGGISASGGAGSQDIAAYNSPVRSYALKAQSTAAANPVAATVASPMIARTASLSVEVKDFAASRASLDGILARHHGYPAQLTVNTTENTPRAIQASLRVPAPELAAAIADLKSLGRVETESQSGEEVTQQHTDLVARLRTARDTEDRFEAILKQHTGTVSDILEVEQEIARVRGEIERMETEQQTLEHRVDFATVELQLVEDYKAQFNPPTESISTRVHNAFVSGIRNATGSLLGILLFFEEYGPVLLIWAAILGLPALFVWRRYRKALASMD